MGVTAKKQGVKVRNFNRMHRTVIETAMYNGKMFRFLWYVNSEGVVTLTADEWVKNQWVSRHQWRGEKVWETL